MVQHLGRAVFLEDAYETRAGDESLWRARLGSGLWDDPRAVPYRPATGLQVGHEMVLVQWRRGRKLVSGRPRVQDQAPVPEAAMDWCWWECELTEDLAWKPCRSTT